MSYPHFVAIDASSWEDEAHPIAIAWSMTDGRIKTTLIQPEDDWEDWDYALEDIHGINQDTLYQRGETCWSVIRELENDLEQPWLYADDQERTEALLEKIYEACGRDLSIEIGLFSDDLSDREALNESRDALHSQHLPCDERVLVMLQCWVNEHGHPQPAADDNGDADQQADENEE